MARLPTGCSLTATYHRGVSVPVALDALREQIEQFGPVAFLVTVADDRRPHVVSVNVAWERDDLVAGTGKTTSANVTRQPSVSLVWPAPGTGDYGLIVDGKAEVRPRGDGTSVAITPSRAVLHRLAGADGEGPSCIAVL
jgi:hypothetical protein